MKPEFFSILFHNQNFCAALGRVVLAAGRLESLLREYLELNGVMVKEWEATLGKLTLLLKDNNLITRNGEMHFNDMKSQRNYLTHKLFDLFAERIEETVLPRTDLLNSDTEYFTERADILANDLDHFANSAHTLISGAHKGKSNIFRT